MIAIRFWLFAAVHLLLRVCNGIESVADTGFELVLLYPQIPNIDVQNGNTLRFHIGIKVAPGMQLPTRSFLCILQTEGEEEELCVSDQEFHVTGFLTSTLLFNIFLKSYMDEISHQNGKHVILASKLITVDLVDDEWMHLHIQRSVIANSILHTNPALSKFDYLFDRNEHNKLGVYNILEQHGNQYTVLAKAISTAQISVDATAHSRMNRNTAPVPVDTSTTDTSTSDTSTKPNATAVIQPIKRRIAFFMTSVRNPPPSQRFVEWICDNNSFAVRGFELTILTALSGIYSCFIYIILHWMELI